MKWTKKSRKWIIISSIAIVLLSVFLLLNVGRQPVDPDRFEEVATDALKSRISGDIRGKLLISDGFPGGGVYARIPDQGIEITSLYYDDAQEAANMYKTFIEGASFNPLTWRGFGNYQKAVFTQESASDDSEIYSIMIRCDNMVIVASADNSSVTAKATIKSVINKLGYWG
jgi:hypothetical protein